MRPQLLAYSSHDRCEEIHRPWIVQRALEHWENKTVFYLSMSSHSLEDQEHNWSAFSAYLDRFRPWGLEPRTFFFRENLYPADLQCFFDWLRHSEVVILDSGSPSLGMERYRNLGLQLNGDGATFEKILRERMDRGLLTVGYSAGADQICQEALEGANDAFGLIQKVITTHHHEPSRTGHLRHLAQAKPECLVFGLPNDSGIAVEQGTTQKGSHWQILQFIVDSSWDKPEDHWHIKTRQGARIEHLYADGRDWQFWDGDLLLRFFGAEGKEECWIKMAEKPGFLDYLTQQETGYRRMEDIFAER